MTTSVPPPTVSQYVQTAGVKPGQGCTWLAVDPTDDPMYAVAIMSGGGAERPWFVVSRLFGRG
jgi:hypothetical protein